MDFALTEEQRMIVETVRRFVDEELVPYEDEVEKTNAVRPELIAQIHERAQAVGLYAANMPEELGGGGLDAMTMTLMEIELGKTSFALQYAVARPSNILRACTGDQVERYLLPTIRGERVECLAMTEPAAGSDLRSMTTRAVRDGDTYVLNGTKHFISYADVADYAIVFAASGEEQTVRGPRKRITSFLVDKGTPGFEVRLGSESVSHRGFHHCELVFTDCRVPVGQILGEEHKGFDVANTWLGATRLTVAAQCVGRARRVLDLATEWAASRKQFGQAIGEFQNTRFRLARMATEIEAARQLMYFVCDEIDQKRRCDKEAAMVKFFASEMAEKVTSEALQIFGGAGYTTLHAVERYWRDARLTKIFEGTSEIQQRIISDHLLGKPK
ncbi:MAG: acyl-CoA dehydrogenase family protein [Enhydrobacter sp.]|nr:acyl-CoA dehydrogenase family protein [Enhydrobacter sp.]